MSGFWVTGHPGCCCMVRYDHETAEPSIYTGQCLTHDGNPGLLRDWTQALADAGLDVPGCLVYDSRTSPPLRVEMRCGCVVSPAAGRRTKPCRTAGCYHKAWQPGLSDHDGSDTIYTFNPGRPATRSLGRDAIARRLLHLYRKGGQLQREETTGKVPE